jgi:hypothetical protein
MTEADNLRLQIERARRFAASMTTETEQIRFESMSASSSITSSMTTAAITSPSSTASNYLPMIPFDAER